MRLLPRWSPQKTAVTVTGPAPLAGRLPAALVARHIRKALGGAGTTAAALGVAVGIVLGLALAAVLLAVVTQEE